MQFAKQSPSIFHIFKWNVLSLEVERCWEESPGSSERNSR